MFGIKKRIIAAAVVALAILGGGVYAASTGIVPLRDRVSQDLAPVSPDVDASVVEEVKQVPPAE
jgi:hypothetical protein